MLVVAIDIVGGVFALNMGRFETDQGLVWYFAPDTVEWESLELKYSEFITWVATGDLDGFYEAFRWNNWEKDVEGVDGFNEWIDAKNGTQMCKRHSREAEEIEDMYGENKKIKGLEL